MDGNPPQEKGKQSLHSPGKEIRSQLYVTDLNTTFGRQDYTRIHFSKGRKEYWWVWSRLGQRNAIIAPLTHLLRAADTSNSVKEVGKQALIGYDSPL